MLIVFILLRYSRHGAAAFPLSLPSNDSALSFAQQPCAT